MRIIGALLLGVAITTAAESWGFWWRLVLVVLGYGVLTIAHLEDDRKAWRRRSEGSQT